MAGGGGVTLFSLGEHLDWMSLTLCMIGLIVFTIIFEVMLHNLEHRITNPSWTKMLSKVYKELMILGFISFVFLMIRQFMDLPTTELLMFELSHIWIFSVAVFFVIHAVIFLLLLRKVKRHWDATSHMDVTDLLQKYNNTSFFKLPKLWYDLFGRGKVREEMGFHIAKSLFLRVHSLPKNFDFAKYLRRSLTQHITDQLDVKESTWVVVISVMVLNMMRLSATGALRDQDPFANVALGWIILLIAILLLIQSRRSKNKLLMKAGCADMASLPKALMLTQMAESLKLSAQSGASHRSRQGRRSTIRALHSGPIAAEGLDLGAVYPFSKPSIFTKTLEVLMLLQCYSLGLLTLLTGKALIEEYVRALPQLLVMIVVSPRILKNHVFVHSITHINKQLVEEVMDIMEVTFLLRTELALVCFSTKVVHLDERTAKHLEHAERLFGEIDTSNSGFVEVNELKAFLNRIGLHHTPRQFKQLLRSIDHDQSHKLSLREFSVLVEHGAECVHLYRESLSMCGRSNEQVTLGDVFEFVVERQGYKVRSGYDTFADQVLREGTLNLRRHSSLTLSKLHKAARDVRDDNPSSSGRSTRADYPEGSVGAPATGAAPPPTPTPQRLNPLGIPLDSPLLQMRGRRGRNRRSASVTRSERAKRAASPAVSTPPTASPAPAAAAVGATRDRSGGVGDADALHRDGDDGHVGAAKPALPPPPSLDEVVALGDAAPPAGAPTAAPPVGAPTTVTRPPSPPLPQPSLRHRPTPPQALPLPQPPTPPQPPHASQPPAPTQHSCSAGSTASTEERAAPASQPPTTAASDAPVAASPFVAQPPRASAQTSAAVSTARRRLNFKMKLISTRSKGRLVKPSASALNLLQVHAPRQLRAVRSSAHVTEVTPRSSASSEGIAAGADGVVVDVALPAPAQPDLE